MKPRKKLWNIKLIELLRTVKIKNRLLCIFLFVSLIPVTSIGIYAYNVYTQSIHEKLNCSNEQAMYLLNQNLITNLNVFRKYIDTLSVNKVCQQMLSRSSVEGFLPNEEDIKAINRMRAEIPFPSIYLKNLRIVDRNHNIVYDLGYDDIDPKRFSELVANIDESAPYDSLQYIHTYRSKDKIVLGRKIYNMHNSSEHIGYILIYLDEKFFSNTLFTNVSFGDDSNIMLVQADGYIISSQDEALLGTCLESDILTELKKNNDPLSATAYLNKSGETQVMISNYNADLDNYLVATFPYSYISGETRSINIALILIAVLLIFICLYITLLVYASIMQPINHIIAACSIPVDDDLNIIIGDASTDELGFLSQTIDGMMQKIQMFSIQQTRNQEQMRHLELGFLQSQINSHFLLNTLNSLRVVARMNDVPILEQGITSLTFLLQHTLVKKQELIPLSLEIKNLNHYFTLQSIRYAGMFDVTYNLNEETLIYEIPRFVLQPLAENAIINGTSGADAPITITIESNFSADNTIELILRDDGCGFATENEACPDAGKTCSSGIGVHNVNQRIKLHYGEEYGVRIESSPGNGTVCFLTIPCRRYKEGSLE